MQQCYKKEPFSTMTYYSSSTCFSLRRIQLASFEQPSNRKGSHLKQVGFVDFSGIGCPRRNWQYSLRFYGKKNMETSRKRPCCGTISFGTRAATRKTVHNVAFPLLGWVCASYLHPDKGGSESSCKKVSLAFVSAAIRRWIAKAIRWLLIAWVSLLSFSNTCSASSIETQGLSHVLSTNFVLAEATFHPSVSRNRRSIGRCCRECCCQKGSFELENPTRRSHQHYKTRRSVGKAKVVFFCDGSS